MLEIQELRAGYGAVEVLRHISLNVDAGQVVALLGANGAGKSTLLRAISGIGPWREGRVLVDAVDVSAMSPEDRPRHGLGHVPERRGLFASMTVEDNLMLGATPVRKSRAEWRKDLGAVFERFPVLATRRHQRAGLLSGGEQQMCAIGRALLGKPKVLLVDEPTQGLAPLIVGELGRLLTEVSQTGVAVLLAEQNVNFALGIASEGVVLRAGNVVLRGAKDSFLEGTRLSDAYLGSMAAPADVPQREL